MRCHGNTMTAISIDSPAIDSASDIKRNDDGDSEDRRWKICILCEPSPVTYMSGQASRFRLLMQHMSDHCQDTHKLQLITADAVHPTPPESCFDGKIPIHYTLGYCPPAYRTATLSVDTNLKTLRVLFPLHPQREKFDLIHVSSPGILLFSAIVASQIYQIPLLMSYHTHLPVYARSYFPYPLNSLLETLSWFALLIVHYFADLTLVTSPQIADEFTEHYSRALLPTIPLRVWKKGVDTTMFHPKHKDSDMRKRMTARGNSDDFLLVYIGRLAREKRLKDLKGILDEMNNRHIDEGTSNDSSPATRLCIVGSGPQEDELRKHFEGTPTVFMGRLDGIELSQAFASGDVFCMPSDSETLGFVILESMASGVPCVAARVGGPVDLIEDGSTGYLVPTGDVVAFADRLELLQKNPGLHRNLSVEGRQETERWSWYASMDEIPHQAYPQCIENFRSKRVSQRLYRWFVGLANAPSKLKNS